MRLLVKRIKMPLIPASDKRDLFHLEFEDQKAAMMVIRNLMTKIIYGDINSDEEYEYRAVILHRDLGKWVPSMRLMSKDEVGAFGVRQSEGWEHYMLFRIRCLWHISQEVGRIESRQ